MPRLSERAFFVSCGLLIIGLAIIDAGLGGRERVWLVPLVIVGVGVLWFLSRSEGQ